ncbi:MAG: hypothetical protein LBD09_00165, partial [Treponema sp.]|nr:hypothetical protein [Treponema sp.]
MKKQTPPAQAVQTVVDWESVIGALKTWRKTLSRDPDRDAPGEPSVSTVAERYQNDPWAVLVSTILSLRTKD